MALIIYSANTGRLRRLTRDEIQDDAALLFNNPVGQGEGVLMYPADDPIFDTLVGVQAEITAQTGLTPTNDRYVVVDPANDHQVEGVYILDPACGDSIQDRTLVADANALPGSRLLSDGSFQRPLEHINHDIDGLNTLIIMYAGNNWRQRMLAKGMTNPEINVLRSSLTDEATALLTVVLAEQTAREGVRT